MGIPPLEIEELISIPQAFPHVKQVLYPSNCQHTPSSQLLTITQLPSHVHANSLTGLSPTYHVQISFDKAFEYTREEAKNIVLARLVHMKIPLDPTYPDPLSIICRRSTSIWNGLIKLRLQSPDIHAIPLLQGNRPFVLKMRDGTYQRGKVEKAYERDASPSNLTLYICSPSLQGDHHFDIHTQCVTYDFESKINYEILYITKIEVNSPYAFINSTNQKTYHQLLKHGFPF